MNEEVGRVRRFNRVITQRIGVLTDDYLGRARPLGASRLLWEVDKAGEMGKAGAEVRMLRDRLGLDSGYVSRLLRGLEADGLVVVQPDPDDRRVRRIRLTRAGVDEAAELDRRAEAFTESLLAPLSPRQRIRLVEAMATVELLLTAGLVEIAVEDPRSPAARFCLESYYADLRERFGFDPAQGLPFTPDEHVEPAGLLLVARLTGEPVGCGALKLPEAAGEPAHLKRVWVAPHCRQLGLGRRLVETLEGQARDRGAGVIRLETNGRLHEAISLYRARGYVEVAPFNDEPFAHHWFEKSLVDGPAESA
jgi:DNA-binding MarR family transcriptional regulator/GNAT superfamily N-acetyltransferase